MKSNIENSVRPEIHKKSLLFIPKFYEIEVKDYNKKLEVFLMEIYNLIINSWIT